MTAPHLLDPPALHAFALTLAAHEQRHHWSIEAIVAGRVQDEGLFRSVEFGAHPTARAWAFDKLDWPTEKFRVRVAKLWPLMKRHRAQLGGFEAWAAIPLTRATLLTKVMAAGGDIKEWLFYANQGSSESFRRLVANKLGREAWMTFRCRIPVALDETITTALALALPKVLDTAHPDPERVLDKDTKFRCLERLVAHYLSTHHLDVDDEAEAIA